MNKNFFIDSNIYNNLFSYIDDKLLCDSKMKFIGKYIFEIIIIDCIINNNIDENINECDLYKIKINICDNKNIVPLYDEFIEKLKFKNKKITNLSNIDKCNILMTLIGSVQKNYGFNFCKSIIEIIILKTIDFNKIIIDYKTKNEDCMSNKLLNNEDDEKNENKKNNKNTIFNVNNKYITKKYLQKIFNAYGIAFNDKKNNIDMYQKAMVNCSYVISSYNENTKITQNSSNLMDLFDESYDKLEFLGDSIIHAIFTDYLFQRYENNKNAKEGFLTKIRTKLENGKHLAKLSVILGLHEFAIMSQNKEKYDRNNIEEYNDIYEDIFEAFIAALYKDKGYMSCKKFLFNLLDKHVDLARLLSEEDNYKDLLLKHCHKQNLGNIVYNEIKRFGPDNKKKFEMEVLINNIVLGSGLGKSKKEGEQQAAKNALHSLGYYKNNDDLL